jgi:hypothetical protein
MLNVKKYAEVSIRFSRVMYVTFTGNEATDDNFPIYLEEIKKVYDQKTKIAIVFDATNAVFPAAKYQKMQAKYIKENENLIKEYCVGTAYIIPNIVIRNALKAIFKFQKQAAPYVIFKEMSESGPWINEQFKKNI